MCSCKKIHSLKIIGYRTQKLKLTVIKSEGPGPRPTHATMTLLRSTRLCLQLATTVAACITVCATESTYHQHQRLHARSTYENLPEKRRASDESNSADQKIEGEYADGLGSGNSFDTVSTTSTSTYNPAPRNCSQLGWRLEDEICGASNLSNEGDSKCFMHKRFMGARGVCHDVGARLCTVDEVVEGAAKGTGCS